MRSHHESGWEVQQAESMTDFVDYAKAQVRKAGRRADEIVNRPMAPETYTWKEKGKTETWTFPGRQAWFGRSDFSTIEELTEITEQGWKEGLQRVAYAKSFFNVDEIVQAVIVKRTRRYSEEDGEINVDRFLAGRDDFYETTYRQTVDGQKIVQLVFGIHGDRNQSESRIFSQVAVMLALVDLLEEKGYQVEVILYAASMDVFERGIKNKVQLIKVKKAGSPLDMEAIVSMASPWLFRTWIFLSMFDRNLTDATKGNLGHPTGLPELAYKYLDPHAIVVPRFIGDETAMILFLKQTMDKILKGDTKED